MFLTRNYFALLLCLISLGLPAQKMVFPYYFEETNETESDGAWGIVDDRGKQVMPPTFQYLGFFNHNGEKGAWAICKQDEQFGIVDRKGRMLLAPTYDLITYMGGGNCVRVFDGENYGIYNVALGRLVLPVEYSINVYALDGSYGRFFQAQKGREVGVVNDMGEFIVPLDAQFFNIYQSDEACPVFQVVNSGNISFVDCHGDETNPVEGRMGGDDEIEEVATIVSLDDMGMWDLDEPEMSDGERRLREGVVANYGDSIHVQDVVTHDGKHFGLAYRQTGSGAGTNRWGLVDSSGTVCLPITYNEVQSTSYFGIKYVGEAGFGVFDLDQSRAVLAPLYHGIDRAYTKLGERDLWAADGYYLVTRRTEAGIVKGCASKQTGTWYVPREFQPE